MATKTQAGPGNPPNTETWQVRDLPHVEQVSDLLVLPHRRLCGSADHLAAAALAVWLTFRQNLDCRIKFKALHRDKRPERMEWPTGCTLNILD
ncbi:MAG: hypothetical protein HY290_02710 [Planctomycetia bacterium]|nr:hypothetical protein [Planctomycetia bacterium]